MKVGLIRHSKVLYRYSRFSTGKKFQEGIEAYNASSISRLTFQIRREDFPICFVSSMKRAIETAKLIYPHPFVVTDQLIEVPYHASFLIKYNFPTILRKIIGRTGWFFNYNKMVETREQSIERAEKFISYLLTENQQNVLLITHGFFMQCLRMVLIRKGFKGYVSYYPKNATLFVLEKN